MSHWGAVVHVEDEDGDDDAEGDEDHGEEEVLPDEGDDQRGGGDDLGDEEEEHGEGEEDGDAQGDLLPAVGGQVEDQHGETGDEQAGDDEVDGVEQRESPDHEEVGDVWVDLVAAVVLLGVVRSHGVNNGPLATLPVVLSRTAREHVRENVCVGVCRKNNSMSVCGGEGVTVCVCVCVSTFKSTASSVGSRSILALS